MDMGEGDKPISAELRPKIATKEEEMSHAETQSHREKHTKPEPTFRRESSAAPRLRVTYFL
jgi:hypothetical protein